MTINTSKTECIFFGPKGQVKKFDGKTVNYLSIPLERKTTVKYLGVYFDKQMQWEKHIKAVKTKVHFKLSKIKSIASYLTKETKKLLINALVMPHFHYCSPAWSSATQGRLSKLNKKLQSAKRFLGNESDFSLQDLIDKNDSILIFKAMNHIAPD